MFSRLFFSHVTPVIRTGLKKSLEPQDLFELPRAFSAFEKTVDEDRVQWSSTPLKMILSLFGQAKRFWIPAYLLLLADAGLSLLTPVLVNHFVKSLSHAQQDPWTTLGWGLSMGLCALLSGLSIQHYFCRILGVYQILTNAINRKIFSHTLKLKKSEKDQMPVGDVVNHMSSDSDSIANLGSILGDLIYLVVVLIGFVGLLFYYMGTTAWVGVLSLVLLVPVIARSGKKFSSFDEDLMKKRDERVTLMSQILSSIRVIKSFVWEKSITREVQKIRHDELRVRGKLARAEMFATIIFVAVGTLVLFLVLGTHVLRGFELDAALVFTMVSLFRLIEEPFGMFSRVVSSLANAKVAAQRLVSFMKKTEVSSQIKQELSGPAFQIENLSIHYGVKKVLDSLSLEIPWGENLAVIGSVGSGKTSLLLALSGEVDFMGQVRKTTRSKALVPQDAFIVNSTLRENLTFGNPDVTEAQLRQALWVCGLEEDFKTWKSGFDTEIGEKGVNLSGGQKQRLSLARTFLQRPDLVLLDDPLSAVDPKTEALLFERLIEGAWKGITRITATHRLEFLSHFDRILFLQDGKVQGLGTFQELTQLPAFNDYIREHQNVSQMETQEADKNIEKRSEENKETKVVEKDDSDRVTIDEDREYGAVKGSVYWDYVLSLAGSVKSKRIWILSLLMGSAILSTTLPLLQKLWLAQMTDSSSRFFTGSGAGILIYGLIGCVTLAGILFSDLYWLHRGLKAGRDLHDQMLQAILGAQVRFFDSHPVGRILQRFSRDIEAVDIQLQWCFENSIKAFLQVFVNLVLILLVVPLVIVVLLPVSWFYYRFQRNYRASAREVKRLDSLSRSPRYAHFKESVNGLVVLRSLGRQDWFYQQFAEKLTYNQRMFYSHYMVNRWFSSRIPLIGSVVASGTTTFLTLAVYQGTLSSGLAGMVAVSSLGFWGILNWGIRIWADVEARMTSVERIRTFIAAPQEDKIPVVSDIRERPTWPEQGRIEFQEVFVRYASHWPQVLKGLSFQVEAGTKTGIIGRTGSGKSTVFQALCRFIEVESGSILIDGVNTKNVEMDRLRKSIAIIPQDPHLFLGSLRANLDRFGRCSDDQIWNVLEQVRLKDMVESLPRGLAEPVVENGMNFSQGQRQLICLARALLAKARIIILDEATASVDVKTDAAVQQVIRETCKGLTMLIIAHRLGTVRDCDQILELSDGRLRRRLLSRASKTLSDETLTKAAIPVNPQS